MAAYFATRWAMTLPPPTGPLDIGLPIIFKFSLNLHTRFLYAVCMYTIYMPYSCLNIHVRCTYVHHAVCTLIACTLYAHMP